MNAVTVSRRLWNAEQTEAINWQGPGLYAPRRCYSNSFEWVEWWQVESEKAAYHSALGTPSEWTEEDIAEFS